MHIGVDQGSGLICKLQMTTAQIHDRRVFCLLPAAVKKLFMQTECSKGQDTFEGFGGRKVEGGFNGGVITSSVGVLFFDSA